MAFVKYPVKSISGQVYRVCVYVGAEISEPGINIKIYAKNINRGVLSFRKFKLVKHYNMFPDIMNFTELLDEFDSVVDVIKHYVEMYETEIAISESMGRLSMDRLKVEKERLSEWDGEV